MNTTLLLAAAITIGVATPSLGSSWTSSLEDGIKMASIAYGADHEIMVMCDAGVNAPITSISFVVAGIAPDPNSQIRLKFDKEEPIYTLLDNEGGIESFTAQGAQTFSTVLKMMKSKGEVSVRLFDGSEHVFALRGSSKSIGTCKADYQR